MKKLKKGFEACNILGVTIEGERYDLANLKKGGLTIQSAILFGKDDKWEEISVKDIGTGINVSEVKDSIESGKIPLIMFGFASPDLNKKSIEDLRHDDYMRLEGLFPGYEYYKISLLHRHLSQYNRISDYTDLLGHLRRIADRGESIEDFIKRSDAETQKIINNYKPNTMKSEQTQQREALLTELGLTYVQGEDCFTGHGFTVTGNEIENMDGEQWPELISFIEEAAAETQDGPETENPVSPSAFENAIADTATAAENFAESHTEANQEPAAEAQPAVPEVAAPGTTTPAKKPISIEIFNGLDTARIVEVQFLKDTQEKIILANPFVPVTDKESLKRAKAVKATLLKASTTTEAIDTNATKYLNAFKKKLSGVIAPLAKLTRDAYDKQTAEIKRFEDAEAKRLEEERALQTKKVEDRKKLLNEVPFEFNGSVYSVGTFYIMPSQLESEADEAFAALIAQGVAVKTALDAAATAESEKDRKIREMEEEIARLKGEPVPGATAAPVTVEAAAEMIDKVIPAEETPPPPPGAPEAPAAQTPPPPPAATSNTTSAGSSKVKSITDPKWTPAAELVMSPHENSLLNAFDMGHMALLDPAHKNHTAFVKCREFYKMGLRDLADGIIAILDAPTQEGVKKSEQILILAQNSKK